MRSADARALLGLLLHGIAPEVDLDEIDPAAPLADAAELDSMDFLNLVNALYDGLTEIERFAEVLAHELAHAEYFLESPERLAQVVHQRLQLLRLLLQHPQIGHDLLMLAIGGRGNGGRERHVCQRQEQRNCSACRGCSNRHAHALSWSRRLRLILQ